MAVAANQIRFQGTPFKLGIAYNKRLLSACFRNPLPTGVLFIYPLRLSPGLPQVFMANTASLLPGTLSAALDRSVLKVPVLDRRNDFLSELEAVEQSIDRIFGTSL
jgi:multisubunit Na+/H+ antiporter MnhE subunit